MTRSSLTARVLLLATLWAVIALVAIAIVISQLYRNGSERAFADLLRAQLNSVINTVTIDEQGQLTGRPQLGDLVFRPARQRLDLAGGAVERCLGRAAVLRVAR
jgi:hypothetical protein